MKLRDVFKGKKGILFAVPGAFTPGCSKSHLPSYIADFDKLKAKGVDVIVCTATNDSYVMAAWGEQQGATGKVRMVRRNRSATPRCAPPGRAGKHARARARARSWRMARRSWRARWAWRRSPARSCAAGATAR